MTLQVNDPSGSSGGSSSSAPTLEELLKDKGALRQVYQLERDLRQSKVSGPSVVAQATAKTLRQVVSAAKFRSLDELITIIKAAGSRLQRAQVSEQAVGNITRRVLHLLREEAKEALLESQKEDTVALENMIASARISSGPTAAAAGGVPSPSPVPSPSGGYMTPSQRRPSIGRMFGSFSISDLVAVGAASSAPGTPFPRQGDLNFSGASTPGSGHFQSGSDFFHHRGGMDPTAEEDEEADDGRAGDTDGEDSDYDEEAADDGTPAETPAHSRTSTSGAGKRPPPTRSFSSAATYHLKLKPLLIQAIQELIDELETVHSNIAKDAKDHVHSGEVILTLGYSSTVLAFLRSAAKDRTFTIVVTETAPSYTGHHLARLLAGPSTSHLSVLLVPDSSIFALMPRVSKVVLGAHSVLANGGFLSAPGSTCAAAAARAHNTPVVVLAGAYKVCPDWSWVPASAGAGGGVGGSAANEFGPPAETVAFRDLPSGDYDDDNEPEIVNPRFDYVEPALVDVFVTNVGEHPPSYVYRLIKESYDEKDLVI